jgi:DNA-binding beta-propeller fold protein YncE
MIKLNYVFAAAVLFLSSLASFAADGPVERHYLYVAEPGIRDYLKYGGHGLLVFDIDHGHQFVKRIVTGGVNEKGAIMNVKGICASAATGRIYISSLKTLQCIDLKTEKSLWEKSYAGGADRMSITPDGKVMYLPSLEGAFWNVVDAENGEVIAKITPKSGAHNTVVSPDGRWAFLAGLQSKTMTVADAKTQKAASTIGEFGGNVRPFTINGKATLVFACVNDLLGFEVGDVASGKVTARVEVSGFKKGPVLRHGCPSHGIAMTPDEKEIWLSDAFNKQLHVFDVTVTPPKQVAEVALKDEPGWITMSIDGRYLYPSTGEVIDAKTHKVLTSLKDENGGEVQSEKMVEVDFKGDEVLRAGNQFGVGGVTGR